MARFIYMRKAHGNLPWERRRLGIDPLAGRYWWGWFGRPGVAARWKPHVGPPSG